MTKKLALSLVATSFLVGVVAISLKIDSTKTNNEVNYESSTVNLGNLSNAVEETPGLKKLEKQKQVHNIKLDNNRTVYIEGEIDERAAKQAEQIKRLSYESKKPIFVLINSPGGSVIDGALIISAIEASPAPVYTVCTQICASMAAMIHQYGKERLMVNRAILMFHDAAGGVSGYFPHMISRLNVINRYVSKITNHVAARANVPYTELAAKMHEELWLDTEDAVQKGFADKIVNVLLDPALELDAALPDLNKRGPHRDKLKINIKW